MDEIVYNALTSYYAALSKLGYYKYEDVFRLLVLCFITDLVCNDYRARLTKANHKEIEKALYCLFGKNCLMPYPDYLKMGKLHLGEIAELVERIEALEETQALMLDDSTASENTEIEVSTED